MAQLRYKVERKGYTVIEIDEQRRRILAEKTARIAADDQKAANAPNNN